MDARWKGSWSAAEGGCGKVASVKEHVGEESVEELGEKELER